MPTAVSSRERRSQRLFTCGLSSRGGIPSPHPDWFTSSRDPILLLLFDCTISSTHFAHSIFLSTTLTPRERLGRYISRTSPYHPYGQACYSGRAFRSALWGPISTLCVPFAQSDDNFPHTHQRPSHTQVAFMFEEHCSPSSLVPPHNRSAA